MSGDYVKIEGFERDMPKSYHEFAQLMGLAESTELLGRRYFVVNVEFYRLGTPYLVVTLQAAA